MRRILKQILYGTLYLAVFGGIAAGIYFGFLRPAPSCADGKLNQQEEEIDCGGAYCEDCALRKLKPITALPVQFFGADTATTIFLQLQNPNLNYGAERLDFDIKFFDRAGNNFKTLSDSTFIYPGEIRALVFPAQAIEFTRVARAEFVGRNFVWKKAADFARPAADAREVRTRLEGEGVVVEGVIQNGNLYGLSRVTASAIIANKQGFFVNASKTFVADLGPREERFFKIFLPVDGAERGNIDPARTRVYLEVIR